MFLQLAGARFVGKIILLFVRFIVNAVHFLKCIFSLVFYVIMFLSFEGSDEEKIITIIIFLLINRLFCTELSSLTRFANFLPTVLKTWTPCKYCK